MTLAGLEAQSIMVLMFLTKRPFALLLLLTTAFFCHASSKPKSRVVVLTDITSLTAGVREPDDGQSLIRLLLFSSEFDIEALIASSNLGHGQTVRPELIHQAIDAYSKVFRNLRLHDPDYPEPERLHACVRAGQPIAAPKVAPEQSFGEGKDTPGSDLLISVVDRADPRPVWVLAWGGTADLAQALWNVRATRSPKQQAAFLRKVRVHAVYDQDSTGPVIKKQWPSLFYITRHHGIRGMYRGGDMSLVSPEWVDTNIRSGHGELGALYPNYNGGDVWSQKLGRVRGIKEGDTPSYLFLFPNGLNDPERPDLGGWGGRFVHAEGDAAYWTEAKDPDAGAGDPDPRMSTIYRWRPDFQAELQARLDWCVRPPQEANHPPVPKISGPTRRNIKTGETILLDASGSSDPDRGSLQYNWSFYPDHGVDATIENPSGPKTRIRANSKQAATLQVLLTLRDSGTPTLTRYARVTLNVTRR